MIVASDVKIYGDGLASLLTARPEVRVLGVAGDAEAVVAQASRLAPDVVLIDMAMTDSPQAVSRLRAADAGCVVALALPEVESAFMRCTEAGISAYVRVEASCDELVHTMISALRGEPRIAPRLAESLMRRVRSRSDRDPSETVADLTPREAEVARLVAEGKTNKRIARALDIQLPTVKNHVHRILKKLGVSRRGEVAMRLSPRKSSEPPSLRAKRRLEHLKRTESPLS